MSNQTLQNLGDAIFGDIDNNPFLNELYDDILYNYAITKFNLTDKRQMREIDVVSALRFADLLSKSTHAMNRDKHKMWAQEIIILLYSLYPDNPDVKFYAGSVFANTGNYQARRIIDSDFYGTTALERFFAEYQNDYLTIPAAPELRFFGAQKNAYDHLSDDHFSYSGPTSMGKSFLMRMYIKDQIQHGVKMNFALIVPTKALINEIYKQVIDEDLKNLLSERNYKVVTAAGDIALEGKHNFILVLTPERLLYLLISKPDLQIDYLFIDEAHKLSGKNSRGPFYYKTVDMLLKRKKKPHFVFASPNIPNPEVYLKLLTDIETDGDDSHLCSTFSPVAQIKFSIDLNNFTVSVYNDHTGELDYLAEIKDRNASLVSFLLMFERINREIPFERKQQTIVYCNGRSKAIENALAFADQLSEIQDNDLNALARDITNEVHGDYYLAQIIKKGVAYHIGYLPAAIRMRIEDMFRRGKITTIFCTSTLLEGVNLPADNLFITDNKIFRKVMTPVDFRNLIGRVGRIRFNLYGNVFFVSQGEKLKQEDYVDLLKKEVPKQTLSIEAGPKSLTNAEKKYVVEALLQGNIELAKRNDAQSEEAYVKYDEKSIVISYCPVKNKFEVGYQATKKDPEWIYNISEVFTTSNITKLIINFTKRLDEYRSSKGETLSDEEQDLISENITALSNLKQHTLPVFDIKANAEEEDVSEIFVRVNSGGVALKQNDFILTLLSLYWDEGRKEIEQFSMESTYPSKDKITSYNQLTEVTAQDVIRVVMAYAFDRARLKYGYKLLRGADFDKKGAVDITLRDQRFDVLKAKLPDVLNVHNWHEFLKSIMNAGYLSGDLILSGNAIYYTYAFYLIAKYRFNASYNENMHLTSLWFFYASLVSLYTGSFESTVENHLNSIKELTSLEEYKRFILSRVEERLTNDYFDITLIGSEGLAVSGRGNNAWNAYVAALNILNAKILFSKSNLLVSKLFEPGTDGKRKSLEKHHLFPKAYLKTLGYNDAKINQMANYAFIDWKDNMEILDEAPSIYYPVVCAGRSPEEIQRMEEENALPHSWENMSYEDFLIERRKLMAAKIKHAFEILKNNAN